MVAMNVWPTDAADGAVTSEARWRKMGRLWAPTGAAAAAAGSALQPTLAFPNLTVKAGACWVDGHYCELLADQVLAVTANGLAVVRFDPAANTAELLYRDAVSVPAQSPTGTYEMPVAKITGSVLTDARPIVTPDGTLVFASVAGRDLNRPTPTPGSFAYTVAENTFWQYGANGWTTNSSTPWVNVTFQNGWVNRASGQVVQYRKEGDVVRIRGHCQNGTAPPSVVFTLPAGFRPPATENIFATISNNALGQIYIDGGGGVYAWVGTNAFIELNCSFSTSAT